ncbi:Dyp-type peroxidase [Accumulibacter sp.]|uniref:Dyp-type peroxidase n=1 Tax=Accumulibacter sp. TaxID=2053492 RepID=UPI001AC03DDE|nr:Dyp-type peroxidase [Accumulibacter sp.]MBN8454599.1 Dyp-type peroxidase [Accumulibacter sp.]MBO3707036.1 Dyp-type peroxidase [Candidatus Accumulibacter conexus]
MNTPQAGILLPLPPRARYLSFVPDAGEGAADCLQALAKVADGERTVVGLGRSLLSALAVDIGGLRPFPSLAGAGVELPATPAAIWVWLRGEDRGELLQRARRIERLLAPAFRLAETLDAFVHDGGRDLSGYEDGTENPVGDAATAAAIVGAERPSLAGSSFVAVQRWLHDLARFEQMPPDDRDLCIGRRRRDNEEIDDAPESAHVKRTAQESFTPPAFVLRRSMPWTEGPRGGLLFVAFATSFDPFEAQLRRMVGIEDGIVDALFRFTRPQSGAYFWCPAMRAGRLDLSPLRL